MDGCTAPKCHEAMQLELNDKVDKKEFYELKRCSAKNVSKKAVWAVVGLLVPLIFILGGVAINSWSQQESNHLRYVDKRDMVKHEKEQAKLRAVVENMGKDIEEIKSGQNEARKDIKEILRHLRDR